MSESISELWFELSRLFGERFGKPLPKELLTIEEDGLKFQLNNSGAEVENIPQYGIFIWTTGWPLGLFEPGGGCLVMTGSWSEGDLIEWVKDRVAIEEPTDAG